MTFPGLGESTRRQAADKLRGLYVIIDPQLTADRDPLWLAEQVLEGGATALQLRDKVGLKGETLPLAQRLVRLCRDYDAVCIINDHADLAVAAGAHGVHVGQRDLPVAMARAVLKPWQLVGSSNALDEEAVASYEAGADYIAVGAMFPSGSKSDTRPAGLETMRQVRQTLAPKGEPPTEPGPPLVACSLRFLAPLGISKMSGFVIGRPGETGSVRDCGRPNREANWYSRFSRRSWVFPCSSITTNRGFLSLMGARLASLLIST